MRRQAWRIPIWRQGGRLLDVGCGWGEYVGIMSKLGWNGVGIEISEQAVLRAQEQLGLDVRSGTLQSQQFPDHSFDVVTFWDVLEHLEDPSDTLLEAYRILRPGGSLLASVPNCQSLLARLFGNTWCQWDLPRHLSHFNTDTLRALLEKQGFSIELEDCMSVPTTTASSVAYYLNARFGVPHWKQPKWLKLLTYGLSVWLAWFSDLIGRGDTLVVHAQTRPSP